MPDVERLPEPPHVADDVEAVLEEELDGMEIVETLSKRPHRVEGRVDVVEREQRHDGIRGPRHKTKARGRDDGERAFAATQQTREVVSGVVLVETFETPQYQIGRASCRERVESSVVGG